MTTDLIARLEAAPAGSRELSDEALVAVGWEHIDTGDVREEQWVSPGGMYFIVSPRPDPTQSIDDALKWMVPKGMDVGISIAGCGTEHEASAVDIEREDVEERIGNGTSLRLPIAICIAALKVREAGQ